MFTCLSPLCRFAHSGKRIAVGIAFGAVLILSDVAMAGGCGQAPVAGRLPITFASSGVERSALVYVPTGYKGTEKVPLILDLHGSSSDPAEQMDRGMWERTAEMNGFIVIELQGGLTAQPSGWRWYVPGVTGADGPDDEKYISDAIDTMASQYCIDDSRVYGSGYSGGARMLSQYVCDVPGKLAAVGLVAGIRAGVPKDDGNGPEADPTTCMPKKSVPIVAFSGTADPVNPFDGGGAPYWKYGAQAAERRWAKLDGCVNKPKTTRVSASIDRVSYGACAGGSTIEHYIVMNGGHVWPGSSSYLRQPKLGKVTFELNATDTMWTFFQKHKN